MRWSFIPIEICSGRSIEKKLLFNAIKAKIKINDNSVQALSLGFPKRQNNAINHNPRLK
jgi:hypothetical protein